MTTVATRPSIGLLLEMTSSRKTGCFSIHWINSMMGRSHPKNCACPGCVPEWWRFRSAYQMTSSSTMVFGYDNSAITQAWAHILHQTYVRGELFTLLFHCELANCCEYAFVSLINQARQYRPGVWIAQLQDISDWWREKSKFKAELIPSQLAWASIFNCTPRATILIRGLNSTD